MNKEILIKNSIDLTISNLSNQLNNSQEEDRIKILDLISNYVEIRKEMSTESKGSSKK